MKRLLIVVIGLMAVAAQAEESRLVLRKTVNPDGWYLTAAAMTAIAHTLGHVSEADDQSVALSVDVMHLVENYHTDNLNASARIAGAGFRNQDRIAAAFDGTSFGREIRLINAAYKIGYLLQVPNALSREVLPGGDLGELDRLKGANAGRIALGVTAAVDIYRAYTGEAARWNVAFWQSREGTPGVMVSFVF